MPWLKLLHLVAVIVWCGALLYLPAAMAGAASQAVPRRLPRGIFIGVATPAALVAIGSGTLIFVVNGLLAPWLMFKLALVGLLVLGHGACGVLVLRTERGQQAGLRWACRAITMTTLLWLLGVAWLVLGKPP